ncbi:restriction endonuclease subunit S [[Kitasatospora] papulosa]|uniref:restriction endonuclease subunit S n=1 Tax=[Kitasatospora] papulosa TaxID=1464011 RepID=UPI0036C6BFD3
MFERTVKFSELVNDSLLEVGAGRPRSVTYPLPILKVADVLDGKIEASFQGDFPDISQQGLGPKVSRAGDIILTVKGTVGRVAIMPPEGPQFAYSPQLCYFRPSADSPLNSRYLYYWFKSADFWNQADALKSQTDMADFLSLSDVCSLKIQLPSLKQQAGVSDVLGALDDKIAVNERITAKADELSASIFKQAQLESPDQFSEQALSETAEFINGRAFTKDATGNGRMVVRIAEINSGPSGSTVYNKIEVPEKHLARPGDVLFAWSGSLTVARWFRPEAIINQHIFKCVPKNGNHHWIINQLIHRKIDEFRAIAADKATTMGHIQRRHLDEPVQVPNPAMLQRLDTQISPLWGRALCAEQESLSLATLRDTLLPQLMSGRLRVRDAEKIVEDHA